MTSQLMKKETKSRGSIKGHYTKYLIDKHDDHLWYVRFIFNRELKASYKKILDEEFFARMDIREYAHYHKNFDRILDIIERQERAIQILKDKRDTYNKIDFETYDNAEDDLCSICYDNIKQNQFIHTCKTCKKHLHSHCMLYLEDKSKCPMCRSIISNN